jgi:hypothetical protein
MIERIAATTGDYGETGPPSDMLKHLAYAEAAVVLLERLMLLLIEQRIVTMSQMVDAVEDAIATKRQMVVEGEHPHISLLASGLLSSMGNSLAASRGTHTVPDPEGQRGA